MFEVVSEYDPEAELKVPIVHQSMDPGAEQAYTKEQVESKESWTMIVVNEAVPS